ncbi:MAG: class I SAM-dependent methyltransferase [Caulobacteraceae bacterium]|nr:class I SAM-dependent methyltransferase [Caulobacteraceae bacterium]
MTTDSEGQVEIEHLHRYFLAREFVRGQDVLDVASGEGYGSAFLAQTARSVVGVEIDAAAVEHARSNYVAPNLRFEQGSAQAIPLGDQTVDAVVSFETVEHFYDQENFLTEIRRVLRPGGRLIISSPNRDIYSPAGTAPNPFHVRELTGDEFQKLISKYFKYHALLAQRPIRGSVIVQQQGVKGDVEPLSFDRREADRFEAYVGFQRELYYVAMASDAELPAFPNSFYFESNRVDNMQLAESRATVAQKDAQLEEASAELADLRDRVRLLQHQVDEIADLQRRAREIPDLRREIAEKEAIVQQFMLADAEVRKSVSGKALHGLVKAETKLRRSLRKRRASAKAAEALSGAASEE